MFKSFNHRAEEKELMDEPHVPEKDLHKNYEELHWVNQYLGGYKASLHGIKQAIKTHNIQRVVDVGSGGGDTIARICGHFRFKDCMGVDYAKPAISYSKSKHQHIHFELCEYQKSTFPKEKTLIHTALFNHHLDPEENVEFLKWAKHNSDTLVINDLQRSFWAWLGIFIIKLWPGFSYLFKNDAPLSVRRAHSKQEWIDMLSLAGFTNYSITNRPMFRYVIVASI